MFCKLISLSGILFSLLASPAFCAPTYVQSAFNSNYGTSTITATLNAVNSGDTIMVFVAWESATITLTGIADNCGGVYTLVINNFLNGIGESAGMAYGTGSSGACTITATFSGSNTQNNGMIVQEVRGVGALDQSAMNAELAPTNGSTVTSGNVTTGHNGEYIFGAATDDGGVDTFTQGSGFVLRQSVTSFATEDQIQPSAGSIAATFISNNAEITTGIMTFISTAPNTSSAIAGNSIIRGVSTIN